MLEPTRRLSLMATAGVVLAVLAWVFGALAFGVRLGDPLVYDAEEFRRALAKELALSHLFSVLAMLSLLAAVWLSGYAFSVAKVRAITAAGICLALVGVLGWFIAVATPW